MIQSMRRLRSGFVAASFLGVLHLDVRVGVVVFARAYDNGLLERAPLGWNSWCAVGPCGTDLCTEGQVLATAEALVDTGLAALGFRWLVIDDCWQPRRTDAGVLVADENAFPRGLGPVIDRAHALGLKFGLYTSVGDVTCVGGAAGSYGYYDEDARLFADWAVDWVKVDWCGGHRTREGHLNFSRALNATGRPMVLELCRGPYLNETDWGYAPAVAQVWRATKDHHDRWDSTLAQVRALAASDYVSGPHSWAYGDMLMVGGEGCARDGPLNASVPSDHCPGQTDREYRTEMSLYASLKSPLLVGTDIRRLTPIMRELLLNPEVIAVHQDAAPPAKVLNDSSTHPTFVRRLADGSIAIAQPNLLDTEATVRICIHEILGAGADDDSSYDLRDLWARRSLGRNRRGDYYTVVLDAHDTTFLLARPVHQQGPVI